DGIRDFHVTGVQTCALPIYGIIIGNFWQGVVLLFLGVGFIYCSAAIVRIPVRYLVPSVMVLGCFGAYAYTGNVAGPAALFFFYRSEERRVGKEGSSGGMGDD